MTARMPTLLLLLCLWSSKVQAAGLSLLFDFHTGGFSIGTTAVDLEVADGGYRMTSRLATVGLAGFLTGFVSEGLTAGRLDGDAPSPAEHRVDNLWRGGKRWVVARYDGAAPPHFESEPPADRDDRPPVPAEQTANTVDPLTAGLRLALAAPGAPGRVVPVYDGRRRYDLIVERLGRDFLDEPGYRGEAIRMDMRWARVAGFAKPGFFAPRKVPDTAVLWFAPPRPETLGLALPLRIEVDSAFGLTLMRLVEVKIRG